MTPEQSRYFDELALLFVQPGWAEYVKTFEGYKDALTDQAYSHSKMEDYFYAKGRMDCFRQVLGFQSLVEELRKSITEEQETDATDF